MQTHTRTNFLNKPEVFLFFYREELDRMKENIERIEKQTEAMGGSAVERIKGQLGRLTQSTFLKPFLLLNLMINVGLEWGGFPALGNSI